MEDYSFLNYKISACDSRSIYLKVYDASLLVNDLQMSMVDGHQNKKTKTGPRSYLIDIFSQSDGYKSFLKFSQYRIICMCVQILYLSDLILKTHIPTLTQSVNFQCNYKRYMEWLSSNSRLSLPYSIHLFTYLTTNKNVHIL